MRNPWWMLVGLLLACGARSRSAGDDGIGDADADTDVDTDADVDTDSDADLDAGVDDYDAAPDPGRECGPPRQKNSTPYDPQPLYPTIENCVQVARPTFRVSNSSDLDGDVLRYHFQVDPEPGFRSIDLQQSPPDGVPEGPSGFTEWQAPRPLVDGELYYWRVWVDDCFDTSEGIVQVFEVCI